MKEIKLTIPEITPSLNVWERMHWAKRRKIKEDWLWLIASAKHCQRLKKATTKRSVKIVSYRTKALDHDNLVGGCKALIDALTKNDVIVDDSPKWIGKPDISQEIDTKRPRTEITIAEAEDDNG